MRADRVHKDYQIVVCGKTMCVYPFELSINFFDIILGMDWLHKCYAFMEFRSRDVRYCFPNELELVWEGYIKLFKSFDLKTKS